MKPNFFIAEHIDNNIHEMLNSVRLGIPTAAFGMSAVNKCLIASLFLEKVLYIAPDAITAKQAYDAISTLSGKKCAYVCAKDEVITYKDALSKDNIFNRIKGLYEIQEGANIVVCEVEALLQLFPRRIESLIFEKDNEYDYQSLPKKLMQMGYVREYEVESKGTFAIRGDILDVFPINLDNPVRIDFFGDNVERIRPYDVLSGERLEDVKSINVISATEAYYTEQDSVNVAIALKQYLSKIKNAEAYVRAQKIVDDITLKMSQGQTFAGSSFVMPLLDCSCTLFEVIAKNSVIILDECKEINDRVEYLLKEHAERVRELSLGGEAFDFSIAQLISKDEFVERVKDYKTLAVQTFAQSMMFFAPLKTYKFSTTPAPTYHSNFELLITDVKRWLVSGYRMLIFTGNAERSIKITELLTEEGVPTYPVPDVMSALQGVHVTAESLDHGLVLHSAKLVIIGALDLFIKTAASKRIRKRRGDVFTAPEVGDYAVHEKYGIGKIFGTKKIATTDGMKEYVGLEYKSGDKVYVPVEQMDVLSKYIGPENPQLSKIGGGEFERLKERVRQSVKKLAFDLKALYAKRMEQHGYEFPQNAIMMEEFEDAFTYEETPDQLSSIQEIKDDMCSPKVMDRLLCGDVGYGKTEVALRAAYLAVLGGKQVALMCPSTILSEQHFNTACDRFKEFGVRVEKLNRFRTPKQQEKILSELANGRIDMIIGTHRLLSKDVKFYDLGLLILDEEQRFGVEHKERIKNIKNEVDCLTMTATPIPRTLHMSLTGIRDISTINTPPSKRIPVQTYVVEESESLIRDVCIREISRGGQVFILYNRVGSISSFAGRVAEIVPEAKVCYAHGRLDKDALENTMIDFYSGQKNILVTTTIIENGIDLPNANSIIIIDADRLGISQLYQLRGRVGRGTRLAHAYFTFKADKIMTADATQRLKAIMQFTELGSGFKIAMRDLEIRGAGNVLGAEQHGHMDKVGYELYAKFLKEELTGESLFTAELEIEASAYIPETYIESPAGRMDCYKQIAEIRSVDDYKRVCKSMEETYGPMPNDVLNLLIIAVLKSYAAKFSIKKITVDKTCGTLELPSIDCLKDERLKAALDKYKSYVTLSMTKVPLIVFASRVNMSKTMLLMTKFLKFAIAFCDL